VIKKYGSVGISNLTSLPETHDEPVFDGYRKGGCRSGGGEAPKNVMKNDDFSRALFSYNNALNQPCQEL
jgi:hypothetical protein